MTTYLGQPLPSVLSGAPSGYNPALQPTLFGGRPPIIDQLASFEAVFGDAAEDAPLLKPPATETPRA